MFVAAYKFKQSTSLHHRPTGRKFMKKGCDIKTEMPEFYRKNFALATKSLKFRQNIKRTNIALKRDSFLLFLRVILRINNRGILKLVVNIIKISNTQFRKNILNVRNVYIQNLMESLRRRPLPHPPLRSPLFSTILE